MRGQGGGVTAHRQGFLLAPAAQRLGERGIGDAVAAAHEHRQEAARDLVLALRAGFEHPQALAQAVFDALVVAGLEMQARQVLAAAPVAPVQGVAAAQAQRTGDGFAVAFGQEQHQLAWQGPGQMVEELAGQRGRIAVVVEGLQVEAEHGVQLGVIGIAAMDGPEGHAGTRDPRALLADVLAVLVVEGGQEGVEIRPAGVVAPVVLHVGAGQPGRVERGVFRLRMEIDMHRGQPVLVRAFGQCVDQLPARGGGGRQQARAGHGRIGHRAQPLWEVIASIARVRLCPGMIEHELAVRIVLQVRRCRRDQRVAFPQRRVAWRPAPVRAHAAVPFQPGQKCVRDERIAAIVQRVPRGGGNRRQILEQAETGRGGHGFSRRGRRPDRASACAAPAGSAPRIRIRRTAAACRG